MAQCAIKRAIRCWLEGRVEVAAGAEILARAVLFDMDGTLVDSTSVIAALWRRWSARHGVDPDAVLLASPGRRAIETIRMFAPLDVDVVAEAAALTKAAAEETEALVPVEGARTLVQSLPRDRWAVVTSAERALAERWLRHTGLPIPDVLVAAEDVVKGKPDPAGYVEAALRLGFDTAETLVFEDAPSGLAAARAAGARVIAVATTLTGAELEPHNWVRDFSRVRITGDPGQRMRFRIGYAL